MTEYVYGAHGWPLVPSKRFPDELTLACPKCKNTHMTFGTAPGAFGTGPEGRWRMGDWGGREYVKCNTCGHSSLMEPDYESPTQRAQKLIVHLGWDWWDTLNELEDQADVVLERFIDILSTSSPNETLYHKELSRVGIRGASLELQSRAFERARLADDGCPLF